MRQQHLRLPAASGAQLAQVEQSWQRMSVKHQLRHVACRESQKEKELLEKKLERTEKARAQEVCKPA